MANYDFRILENSVRTNCIVSLSAASFEAAAQRIKADAKEIDIDELTRIPKEVRIIELSSFDEKGDTIETKYYI